MTRYKGATRELFDLATPPGRYKQRCANECLTLRLIFFDIVIAEQAPAGGVAAHRH